MGIYYAIKKYIFIWCLVHRENQKFMSFDDPYVYGTILFFKILSSLIESFQSK